MVGGGTTRSRARKKNFNAIIIFFMKTFFFSSRFYDWQLPISLLHIPSPLFPLIHLLRPSVDCHLAQALFRSRQEENKNEQTRRTRRRNPINFTFSFFFPFSDSFRLSHRGRFCTFYFLMKPEAYI